jgi:hypothetical protein
LVTADEFGMAPFVTVTVPASITLVAQLLSLYTRQVTVPPHPLPHH